MLHNAAHSDISIQPTPVTSGLSNDGGSGSSLNAVKSSETDVQAAITDSKELKKAKKKGAKVKQRTKVTLLHCDLIQEDFWTERLGLLED